MVFDLNSILGQIGKDKGIDRKILIEAIESAMLSAARKHYGHNLSLESRYNDGTGEVDVVMYQVVVDQVIDPATQLSLEDAQRLDPQSMVGDELGQKLETESLGRIAAQTARQVIAQRLRDAERGVIYDEFKDSRGEVINGIVQRYDRGSVIVNLGRTEAVLPRREQIPNERYRQGDRLKGLILDVDPSGRGPQIILSRSHNDFLVRLFEQEVPEILEGAIEIKGVAREPGKRAKIAVHARDESIDPVGACVGVKGSRVLSVGQELKGEKIDIITWTSDDPSYIARALAPAEVSRVVVDEDNHSMLVVVEDSELSRAIGRGGENVKLASRLTGWKLDVRSVTAAEEEARSARRSLESIEGIAFTESELLYQVGYRNASEVANSLESELAEVLGCSEERAQAIISAAREAKEEDAVDRDDDLDGNNSSDVHQLILEPDLKGKLIANGITSIQLLTEAESDLLLRFLVESELEKVQGALERFLSGKQAEAS